ncbi:prolyl oligopeptidase family protein [Prosthecobacter fusiformis]|uniref:Prolyl oligopeptidase family protein n=1 Tax=Prosthecobacter fusiformis TaxID=48464 RepID=A0A4R7RNF2_9BACT|nr:prolyl oligopeptidase family serine peptidase [Prosthecobacter fusiformis]TDU64564.1 prolyl oligopeptidase family protein [Prosthecobacter fusiformis]
MTRAYLFALFVSTSFAADPVWESIAASFQPPAEYAGKLGAYASPLKFNDGSEVKTATEWQQRRLEILHNWHALMGEWPPLVERPKLEILETTQRDNFTQHHIRLQIAQEQTGEGYLLIPEGKGPFPAVFVPFYDPETSIGLSDKPLRDFAYQLTKRGFVTLSIGSPGGDARKPVLTAGAKCQPLSYLAYISANAWTTLSQRPEVDAKRIGIMGHSYGGKWAMFGACLWDKYACGVWSDPGIVFDETRQSINYQEPWYLGFDRTMTRKRGLVRPDSPRTGAYKALIEQGHDLVEFQSLMAPRPFLVSGGIEDPPKRWIPLNHIITVNHLLGQKYGVSMTNRPDHSPTADSNEHVYRFLEWALGSHE